MCVCWAWGVNLNSFIKNFDNQNDVSQYLISVIVPHCCFLQLTIVLLLSCAVVSTNLCFLPSLRHSFPCCSGCLSLSVRSRWIVRELPSVQRVSSTGRGSSPPRPPRRPRPSPTPPRPPTPLTPPTPVCPPARTSQVAPLVIQYTPQPPQSTHWLHRLLVYFHTVAPFPFAEHSF